MATINYAAREINVKIVYYGPALSGKTTNLQIIHKKVPQEAKSDMVSLATEADRTLFFDFLPIDLGKIKGFTTKIQLYTVPGQVYYNATRKLVLRGVDGIVFVADSAADKLAENIESLDNMEENLAEYGYSLQSIPVVLQFNKRDCENPLSVEELNEKLNRYNSKFVSAIAMSGKGVFDTLKVISKEVIDVLNKKYENANGGAAKPATPATETPKPVEKITPTVEKEPETEINKVVEPEIKTPAKPIKTDDFDDVFADAPKTIEKEAPKAVASEESFGNFIDLDNPVKPISDTKPSAVEEKYDDIELDEITDVNFEKRIAEREKKSKEIIEGLSAEINLDDMFDMPVEKAPEVKPEPVVSNTAASNHDNEDDFGFILPQTETKPAQPIETPPVNKTENTILEDVLDDVPEAPIPTPTVVASAKSAVPNPIASAFENKYSDGWVPPETVFFSSVDTNSPKTERIIAMKKKPVNPKYKKSFLDNLFKKQPQE